MNQPSGQLSMGLIFLGVNNPKGELFEVKYPRVKDPGLKNSGLFFPGDDLSQTRVYHRFASLVCIYMSLKFSFCNPWLTSDYHNRTKQSFSITSCSNVSTAREFTLCFLIVLSSVWAVQIFDIKKFKSFLKFFKQPVRMIRNGVSTYTQ